MLSISFRIAQHQSYKIRPKLKLLTFGRSHCCGRPSGDKCSKVEKDLFGKYLIVTNTLSSVVLIGVGDLIQQEIEYVSYGKHKDSFNWQRCFHVSLMGFIIGPIAHFFYKTLDRIIPGTEPLSIARKIFLDQTIASPTAICIFFFGVNYFNGTPFKESVAELKKKFWTIYAGDCLIWVPAQTINFYMLPPRYRVIYINLVTICYNVFLSFMKHL